jgi:glyoxylase-like metal-dependent hydrolase (beta-lactamase superfamily II)
MEIISNIYQIPGVQGNSYFLVDPAGLALIDSGMPGNDKKILAFLTSLGYSVGDLKYILITHSDVDHIGSLAALKAATGARIYASAVEANAISTGHPSREIKPKNLLFRLVFGLASRMMKVTTVPVDEFLTDGQVLPVLGGLRVVKTPGHTPGHVSLFLPSAGGLFTGDSILSDQDRLIGPRPALAWDLAQAWQSVQKQAALGAKIVCTGHGPVVRGAAVQFPTR